jgi:hypothetical protein
VEMVLPDDPVPVLAREGVPVNKGVCFGYANLYSGGGRWGTT